MTETQADGLLRVAAFDPLSGHHIATLTAMHQGYLVEELERTGHHPQGFPLAGWLRTIFFGIDDTPVGFAAVDLNRRSVELIYVQPDHRGRGLATQVLAGLAASCPEPMQLKGPLTPGGQALAAKLGLGVAWSTPKQIEEAEAQLRTLEAVVRQRCPHGQKRRGDPRRPCQRCYRALATKTAARMIAEVAAAQRGGIGLPQPGGRPR